MSERTTDALWIAPMYPWHEQPGDGVFYRTQARALARLGLRVTVMCPTPWAPWPLSRMRERWRVHAAAPRVGFDNGVAVVRPRFLNVPRQPSWAMPDRVIAHAAWGARRDWSSARLVHGHFSLTGLAAWRVAKRAGLPFVLTFHGSDMNTWPDEHPDRLADLRAAARDAGAVIAVSAALAERIRSITGVSAIHLPLGCDHRSLAASAIPRHEARQRLGLRDDRVIVLFVGNLLRAKGIRELVTALLGLGDPFFGVLVGGGPEAGYGSRDPRASRLLEYTGPRPHDEIAHYMSAADVLVLPSYREGLPTVIVEAGSLGLPVIASGVGGIPELLGEDRGTILPEVSEGAIRAALARFLDERAAAEVAARSLRQHVLEVYDTERNTARLLDCYRSIAPGLGSSTQVLHRSR